MSSGTASAKQPKLRPPPRLTPASTNTAETLDRLDKLSDWTEEPARRAAAALEGEGGVTPQPEEKNAPKAREKAPEYPWQGEEGGTTSATFRLPTDLYLKLKFLGDTTYGSNMTKILIEALEKKVGAMLRERSIKS